MRERSYTDQQGQQKVFVSVGFVLTDGINTMFAEAVGTPCLPRLWAIWPGRWNSRSPTRE